MAIGDRIPMDSKHVHVEGNDTLVSGTALVQRDLSREFNWWKLRPQRELHLQPIPTDEHGVQMRLCSGGHYEPLKNFARNPARRDKTDNFCKACRRVMAHNWRIQEAEAAGRVLRAQRGRPAKAAV